MVRAMKIAVASDHAGFRYKEAVKSHLQGLGHEVVDFGTHSAESCNYPEFIMPAARAVAAGECARGIVFGGSGNGEAMAANRIRGARCGYVFHEESARLTRLHNDANLIAIGERLVSLETALACVDVFLATPFEGGRHLPRIQLLDA